MKFKKFGALLLSAVLCIGMAAPAFAYEGDTAPVEEPVLPEVVEEEDAVTITDEETGALTPEGNLTLVDDYHTNYSDGSGQQFITLVSKSGATFYLVIDRNAKGQQTVHFMNLVDEADLLTLMEEEDAEAYTAEKEAVAQAELERKLAEEEAKKAAEEATASGAEQPKENKITKYAAAFLSVLALVGLTAGSGIYAFMKQKQKKQAEKEALDPDANYTEDKGDFEIPVEDEPEETGEEDAEEEEFYWRRLPPYIINYSGRFLAGKFFDFFNRQFRILCHFFIRRSICEHLQSTLDSFILTHFFQYSTHSSVSLLGRLFGVQRFNFVNC